MNESECFPMRVTLNIFMLLTSIDYLCRHCAGIVSTFFEQERQCVIFTENGASTKLGEEIDHVILLEKRHNAGFVKLPSSFGNHSFCSDQYLPDITRIEGPADLSSTASSISRMLCLSATAYSWSLPSNDMEILNNKAVLTCKSFLQ